MSFHDLVDQERYRANPIAMARIIFYDSQGLEVLSDHFRILGKSASTDTTCDREYQVKVRAGEKFRDAIHRLGLLKKPA